RAGPGLHRPDPDRRRRLADRVHRGLPADRARMTPRRRAVPRLARRRGWTPKGVPRPPPGMRPDSAEDLRLPPVRLLPEIIAVPRRLVVIVGRRIAAIARVELAKQRVDATIV